MDIGLIDFNGHTVHVSAMTVTIVNPQRKYVKTNLRSKNSPSYKQT